MKRQKAARRSRAAALLAVAGGGALAAVAGRTLVRSLRESLDARGAFRAEAPETTGGSRPFEEVLEGHKYANLTTFRKSGEAVATTVWFVLVDGRAYMTTPPDSGKMKRVRNDPRVVLTPSNARGRVRGESVAGLARPVENEETGRAEKALREKYRFALALFHLFGQREIGEITLEVRPATDEAPEPVRNARR